MKTEVCGFKLCAKQFLVSRPRAEQSDLPAGWSFTFSIQATLQETSSYDKRITFYVQI